MNIRPSCGVAYECMDGRDENRVGGGCKERREEAREEKDDDDEGNNKSRGLLR